MPKRDNEFQRLVSSIQRTLAPLNARVTSSAMVEGQTPGIFREIDVLIESNIASYKISIAVEAKDHKRLLMVNDIETIVGKYKSATAIKVNKVVLVAHRGFSKGAIDRAAVEGIELITLEEAYSKDWTDSGIESVTVELAPQRMRVWLIPHLDCELPQAIFEVGEVIDISTGKSRGTPLSIADFFANDKRLIEGAKKRLSQARKVVTAQFTLPLSGCVVRYRGKDHVFEKLAVEYTCRMPSVPSSPKRWKYGNRSIGIAVGHVGEIPFRAIVPEPGLSDQMAMEFKNPDFTVINKMNGSSPTSSKVFGTAATTDWANGDQLINGTEAWGADNSIRFVQCLIKRVREELDDRGFAENKRPQWIKSSSVSLATIGESLLAVIHSSQSVTDTYTFCGPRQADLAFLLGIEDFLPSDWFQDAPGGLGCNSIGSYDANDSENSAPPVFLFEAKNGLFTCGYKGPHVSITISNITFCLAEPNIPVIQNHVEFAIYAHRYCSRICETRTNLLFAVLQQLDGTLRDAQKSTAKIVSKAGKSRIFKGGVSGILSSTT